MSQAFGAVRAIAAAAVFAFGLPAAFAQGTTASGETRSGSMSDWVQADDIAGRYHVAFPATPHKHDESWNSATGNLMAHHLLLDRGRLSFVVGYADYASDGDPDRRLDTEVRLFRDAGFTLEPVKVLTISEKPARRFSGVKAGSDYIEGLFVVDGLRMYKLMTRSRGGRDTSEDSARFIGSFLPLSPPLPK